MMARVLPGTIAFSTCKNRINQQSVRINVDKDKTKSSVQSSRGSGYEGDVWHDNLAAVIETVMVKHCRKCDP